MSLDVFAHVLDALLLRRFHRANCLAHHVASIQQPSCMFVLILKEIVELFFLRFGTNDALDVLLDLRFRQGATGAAAKFCKFVLKARDLVAITSGAALLGRFRIVVFFFVLAIDGFVGRIGVIRIVEPVIIWIGIVFAFACYIGINLVFVGLTRFGIEFGLKVREVYFSSFGRRRNGWRAGFSGWRGGA